MLQLSALSFSLSIVLSLMLPAVVSNSTTNDSNIYVQCSQLYFDSMTPYGSYVNSLFTSLIDSSSIYNFNKFQISPPPGYDSQNDVVYGLFQCRGDLSSSNCKECVTNSVSQLKTNCPVSVGGGIQLDGCFVKYDNSSFFGADDKMEVLKRCDLNSVGYNPDVLNRIAGALTYLINARNGEYFRSGEYGSILGVAQCVQDLSVSDCQDCLSEACGRLRSACEASTWGDMYLGKCYIRYFDQGSDSHAYNGTSSSDNSSGGGISGCGIMKWIGYIVAAVATLGGLTYYVTNRNSNRNENRNKNTNANNNDNSNVNSASAQTILHIDQGFGKVAKKVKKVGKKVEFLGTRVKILEGRVASTKQDTEILKEIAQDLPKPKKYPTPAYDNPPYHVNVTTTDQYDEVNVCMIM